MVDFLRSPEKYNLKNIGKLKQIPPNLYKEEEIDAIIQERIDTIKKEIISGKTFLKYYLIDDLKAIAKSIGLCGYSKLRKAELFDLIRRSEPFKSSGGK